MVLKQQREKIAGKRFTTAEVVSLYSAKVSVSSGEAVNMSFIDSALMVWDGVLKHMPLRKLINAVAFQIASPLSLNYDFPMCM
jgi:hypothetical protein